MSADKYEISYDGEFLASFRSNGEARDYIAGLLNGRAILGETFLDPEKYWVRKNGHALSIETRVEVQLGGY